MDEKRDKKDAREMGSERQKRTGETSRRFTCSSAQSHNRKCKHLCIFSKNVQNSENKTDENSTHCDNGQRLTSFPPV